MIDPNEIANFLYDEAALLDEGRLEEWLTLFAEDGKLWIPLDPDADPARETSIIYDDAKQRETRVDQLLHEPHWSQRPPSRTVHTISNIRIGAEGSDGVEVRCNLLVTEIRSGGHRTVQHGFGVQRTLAGRCIYRLVRSGERWLIALKKVVLIDRDRPIENLSFIF